MNIFSEKYTRQQISQLKIPEYSKGNIVLSHKRIPAGARLDGYIDHRLETKRHLIVPVFYVEDQLWMSATPMEVASHWVPIQKARGHVGVAGMGMGYYVLQIMKKPEVEKITIYEQNPEVIEYFQVYKRRKGFKKIEFVEGNVYEELKDNRYDFFYNDIYPQLGSEDAIYDMALLINLHKNLSYENYHYWGMEFDIYDSLAARSITAMLRVARCPILTKFFDDWAEYNKRYLVMDEAWNSCAIPSNKWFYSKT